MDFDSPDNIPAERQTLYCVPVPGESEWAKQAACVWSGRNSDDLTGDCDQSTRSVAKRQLSDEDHDEMETDEENGKGQTGVCLGKR